MATCRSQQRGHVGHEVRQRRTHEHTAKAANSQVDGVPASSKSSARCNVRRISFNPLRTQRDTKKGMPSKEGRRQRRKAPAQLGPAAACRPARTPCRPPTPPAAAAAPCAPSRGRSKLQRRPSELARRPTSRCGASPARALASARYRRARRAHKRRLNPSSEPAGGSLLPPPPPPAQGAAAHHRWFTGYQSFPPVSFCRALGAATHGDSSQYGRI